MAAVRRHGWTPVTAPGPSGGDMLRDFGRIRHDSLGYLEACWRRYGDVVQFPIPTPPSYLVTSPTGVRRVLQTNHRNYGKATIQYRNLALVTGDGLLAADTEQWRAQRPKVQPAFHPRAVTSVADHTAAAVTGLAEQWDGRGEQFTVDIEDAMMRTALEIVGAALFGADLRAQSADLVHATQVGLHAVVARTRNPLPPIVPTPGTFRLRAAVGRLDAAVAAIVAARRRLGHHGEPRDMLDVLLAAPEMGDQELRDQIVTFIVAGHETIASALTWSWYLLATHPEAAERLATEALTVLGRDRPATFADVADLPWSQAVFDEALRIYPPGWLVSRKSLGPDEIDGHQIPAKALIIISPYLVHRHPDAGGGDTDFRPERFLAGQPSPVSCEYIPFGAGPRLCIGRGMARVEGTIVLSMLARRFRFTTLPGAEVTLNPMVMLKPRGGLRLRVDRRY